MTGKPVPASPAVAPASAITLKPMTVVGEAVQNSDDPYNTSYNVTNASTATKIDTPIMETPFSVTVVPQQVLRDKQVSDVPGLSHYWSERQVTVDQNSGAILKAQDPGNRLTAGQTFIDWQWPLHTGKAFGWTGRIIVFVAGLACPVLFVTGVIRWLQKRRARKLVNTKNKDPSVATYLAKVSVGLYDESPKKSRP